MEKPRKKVLFLGNHFICLHSYRKELVQRLREEGHHVYLSIPQNERNVYFEDMGCTIIPTEMDRRGVNPIKDLKLFRRYYNIISEVKPDIIFSYTIKPNIYGSIASHRLGYRQICNVTGTGATFLRHNLLSRVATCLYRIAFKRCHKVFFQNSGDKDFFISQRMVGDNWGLLPGSGCNLDEHPYTAMPIDETINFIFIGRVMELKGFDEYLACARAIHERHPDTRFYVAGWVEQKRYETPLAEAEKAGHITYLGYRKDIATWIARCHCTILPSRGGEGVPNVLLESAAMGRPCIGSAINGTRDVIVDGITGYLFETGNAASLEEKVERFLLLTHEEKIAMGLAGRKKVEKDFNRETVVQAYMDELEAVPATSSNLQR